MDLTKKCIESLRRGYLKVTIVAIDNGSKDASTLYIRNLSRKDPHLQGVLLAQNLTHGPALHLGMRTAQTQYVFTLDSDCVVKKPGFIETLLKMFREDARLYAVGHKDLVNNRGTARKGVDRTKFIQHVHPSAMMIDRKKYLQLPPFEYHGSPAVANMRAVPEHGWKLADFPIAGYIHHMGGGTRKKFSGRWDPAHPHRPVAPKPNVVPARFEPKVEPKVVVPMPPVPLPLILAALETSVKESQEDPAIPILVPTYNGEEHLRRSIQALLRATRSPYRLYIADACSPDKGLQGYLDALERVGLAIVFRSEKRKDFPTINNWAMQQLPASDYVCLMNSDIEPTAGWLEYLSQVLRTDAKVGIVGARLLYPEHKGARKGLIQHAGVARTAQGAPYHIFRGKPADYPLANQQREINAVTAACMLVRRRLWDQLEGFDEGFVGGQFEDVDFCWRARKAGWKVVYQPKAMLYHFEHGSGMEWVQGASGRNLQRLRSKWPNVFSDEGLFR